jgi:murein DD-endopeptidase MepM/ murein hydrolase activator NlpD
MLMEREIKKILESFDELLYKNTSLLNEFEDSSDDLFGGSNVSIPPNGEHKGQKGWQSNNAWDIMTQIGTPVYAIASGTLKTFNDYGPKPIHRNGKTLFGIGFTVNSDNNLPDVYYTHLKDTKVKKGDKVVCGQLLGFVMDYPGSEDDHLHIAVESGHDIREFLNSDGSLKCRSSDMEDTPDYGEYWNSLLKMTEEKDILKIYNVISEIKNEFKSNLISEAVLQEPVPIPSSFQGNFGEVRPTEIHPGVDIPAASGTQIKAPADGVVEQAASNNPKCGGTIDINYGNGLWSRFCHVKRIDVKAGDKVTQGQVVGLSGGDANDPGRGNSGGAHLHFTLKKDGKRVNPIDYIGKFDLGTQDLSNIKISSNNTDNDDDEGEKSTTTNTTTDTTTTATTSNTNVEKEKYYAGTDSDPLMRQLGVNTISKMLSKTMKEQKLPKEKFFIQYCNVSNPKVSNGEKVSEGQVIGKTTEDVEVSKFDSSYYRENITKNDFLFGRDVKENLGIIIIPKDSNEKIKSPISGVVNNTRYNSSCKNQITIEVFNETKLLDSEKRKPESNQSYGDPLLRAIATAPFKIFQNKYDKDTGELKQKRFGHPGHGKPVDPWIKDAIVAPFKKIGNLYRKEKNEEEEEKKLKKVNENIDRIKKLL